MNDPIDVIITWVDGNDPKHIEKRNKYLKEIDQDTHPWGILEGRFVEVNEVKYCLYSIRKFAPWIRNIFLVTDEQCPAWLTEEVQSELGVIVIDHKIIFRDHLEYLPTFNTRSINTLLWKIPDLADKYIVFNDDCFLLNHASREDFFCENSIIVRGKWHSAKIAFSGKIKRTIKFIFRIGNFRENPWKVNNLNLNSARLIGFRNEYFETLHSPLPSLRSVIAEYYDKNPEIMEENVKYRFRNKFQHTASSLLVHFVLRQGRAIIKNGSDTIVIIPRKGGLQQDRHKFDLLKKTENEIKFLCLQDLFYLKQENPEEFEQVINYLDKTIMSNQSTPI